MSIEITLEAETQLTRDNVKTALKTCGVADIIEKDASFTASFPDSKMSVLYRDHLGDSDVLTDNMEEKHWVIGSRMTFRYVVSNYEQCELEMLKFVKKLAELSEAFFVVAFQYERVWAIRDQDGLKIIEPASSD